MANDARVNTMSWLDEYFDPSNVPDLLEDDADINWMFTKSRVPLEHMFYGDNNYDILGIIHKPTSRSLFDHDRTVYGYEESVPISLHIIDKEGVVNAELLMWLAEAELRLIAETYPFGSYRSFVQMSESTIMVGATVLFSVTYELRYVRNTTA